MKTISACVSTLFAFTVHSSIRARPAALVLAVLASPLIANAQTTRYHVVPLTEISSAQTSCVPTAINTDGVVVGFCGAGGLDSFAVRWQSNGAVDNLGTWADGMFTRAWGINALGQIVGDGDEDGDLRFKALLRGDSGWNGIDGSGGSLQTATGITSGGVIFGNYTTAGSPGTRDWQPVFWTADPDHDGRYDRNGLPKPPATPTAPSGAFVFAANSVGVAVGQVSSESTGNQAGYWSNDPAHSLVILAGPPGLGSGVAYAVSDDGRAAGAAFNLPQSAHAILWQNGSHTPIDLGMLPADVRSEGYGVNSSGQVVGASFDAAGRGRGFIYQDGALTALTTLLDTADSAWAVNEPAGINNHGTIIATATKNGVRHPVKLVPFIKEKEAQTISFALPAGPFKFGDAGFALSATSTSGLPVTFTASGACSVAGDTVSIVGTGLCLVTASQGGDADWLPANDVTASATIGKGAAIVSLDHLAQVYDGTVKVVSASTEPEGLSVQVSITGTAQNAGSYAVTATIEDANYEGSANGTLVIGKADASIVVTAYSVTYDGAPHTATAVATGVAGENLSLSVSLDNTTHTDAGTYLADAWSFAGGINYNDASGTVANTIAPATQAITFGALADRTFGDAPFPISATGGASGNAVTFAAAGTCTVGANVVTLTSAGSCTITASQEGSANYVAAASVARSFTIAPAVPPVVPPEAPLVDPGPQTNQEGDDVDLSLVTRRLRGTFSAVNLPGKLKIDNKGVIRGHVGKEASSGSPYNVVVTYTAPDGASSTVAFSWTILPSGPKGQGNHGNHPEDDKKRGDDDRH